MSPSIPAWMFVCASAVAVTPFAARAECFSMYDTKNMLVYQSSSTPIDLSRPVSEEMALRFPTRALVIATSISCPEGRGGGSSRFIGPEDSGALAYGSATSGVTPTAAEAPATTGPRVFRRARR